MSKGLFDARRKLTGVSSLLKQDKVSNAVHSVISGLQDMLREQLLKSERSEFERLVENVVYELNGNKKLTTEYGVRFEYTPGEEKALLELLQEVHEEISASVMEEADRVFKELEAAKGARFEEFQAQLGEGKLEEARELSRSLMQEYFEDARLILEMAEMYEQAGLFEDAVECLEVVRKLDPGAVYILNKLGINYRKLKKFEASEGMFKKAAELTPDDPNLFFNLGRLYVDWEKWQEAYDSAQKSIELEPGFEVAAKMADYARKRL